MKNENKVDSLTTKMIRAIGAGKNVDAYKILEQITQKKVADKIDKALKNA